MTTRNKRILTVVLAGAVLAAVALVPSFLRHVARGTPILDYIRQHGPPTAITDSCRDASGRLRGLRLDGVRLYVETTDAQSLAGQLLVYPETEDAVRHFRYLPNEEPIRGERSIHYSQRRLFRDESLILVRVDLTGRVAAVESRNYNFFTLYERPSLTQTR